MKNWHIYKFQKIVYPFSFDQKDDIQYDLQSIEVGSEYLSPVKREVLIHLASGWGHYLWIPYKYYQAIL
jgi:hypothetical protein